MKDENMVFGRNAVIELLKSDRSVNKLLIAEGLRDGSIQLIIARASVSKIPMDFVPREKLDKLTDNQKHQGVIAFAAAVNYSTLDEILAFAQSKKQPPFILLLDEIQDPQNFGALLRTAEAVGVHGILIPKHRSVPLNSTVAKTSAGAVEYVKVAQIGNVAETLKQLQELGLMVVGGDVGGKSVFSNVDFTTPLVLVIGNEGKGLRRLTKDTCDILVSIPMVGKINSLNASAAGAVLMYEVFRQRAFGKK